MGKKNIDLDRIRNFAVECHKNQVRKFDHSEYISHPVSVANRVKEFTEDSEIIAAAYLHDVLEDTQTTYEDLHTHFGKKIANIVLELTNDKDEAKRIGKGPYLTLKINKMSPQARLIKIADREHNVSNFPSTPKEFALKYAEETAYILDHLEFTPTANERKLIDSIRKFITPFLAQKIE